MEQIYLCDIDGTLSTYGTQRSPYDETKVHLDTPLPTITVINALITAGYTIIYFSGRTEACYKETRAWIHRYTGEDCTLIMRKVGDNRSDDIVKKEMYDEHIKDQYNVLGVFDDRKRVKRMWVELGLWVFDCNQTDKEF